MPVLSLVNDDGTAANGSSLINEIVREGARRMLAAALEAEVNAYIAELADERNETGWRLVVRNGYHQPRKVTTAAGVVEVKAPQVNDKRDDEATDERKRFSSAILPPSCRKSPKTIRLRTKDPRGADSRNAALATVFKLVESTQQRWRAVNAPHFVALVRTGARFERGQLIERPTERAA